MNQLPTEVAAAIPVLREFLARDYRAQFRPAGGNMAHPFCTPGSAQYSDQLWDWDSYFVCIALRQIIRDAEDPSLADEYALHEKGTVLNWLPHIGMSGHIPVVMRRDEPLHRPEPIHSENMHKPFLVQKAVFISEQTGDYEWLREDCYKLQCFINAYLNHHRHAPTGLVYAKSDAGSIGDDDPCFFGRPPGTCAPLYLNVPLYRELLALARTCERLGLADTAPTYRHQAASLREAIEREMWDDWLGLYFNVDIGMAPYEPPDRPWSLHVGAPRSWNSLLQRIGVWTCFLPLWAGIPSQEQADRMIVHLRDPETFRARFGIRTLSKREKQYAIQATGNPSNWRGPVWPIVNYIIWQGLLNYGYHDDARRLAEDTILLLAGDVKRNGGMHEYYEPDTGQAMLNKGFLNWNCLVANMIAWIEGRPVVADHILK